MSELLLLLRTDVLHHFHQAVFFNEFLISKRFAVLCIRSFHVLARFEVLSFDSQALVKIAAVS